MMFSLLLAGFMISCNDLPNGPEDNPGNPQINLQQVTYELDAISNDGEVPGGVEATATFQELNPT